MTLPGEVERVLNDLGFEWPQVDETDLFSAGSAWLGFAGQLGGVQQQAVQAAQQVATINQGEAIDAFRAKWEGDNAPAKVLGDAQLGVNLGGAAMLLCAGVVLTLKICTIVNITILIVEIAQAIATAVPTFGASLAEIPVFKEITSRIVQALINEAVMAVLG
ncbi:WXG100-like domain-containing protein [Jatrophihabitans fulvus]